MTKLKAADSCAEILNVNSERLRHLDEFFKQLTDDGTHMFSAIRVLRYGVEIFNGSYGVKSPGGPPLTEQAIFPLASVTKSLVATLLAIMQEDGLIDLWDKLNRYYPEFTGGKKDEVELWQVLCHSSGMSDEAMGQYVNDFLRDNLGLDTENCSHDEFRSALLKARDLLGLPKAEPEEQAVQEVETLLSLRAPLASDPHTAFDYCSTGYKLLGKLIERLTGETLDEYATRKLFKPLKMDDTHFILPKSKWSRVVKRTQEYYGADWYNSEDILVNTAASGGLKSTMHDLAQFGQMYLQEGTLGSARILSPASIRLMTTDQNKGLPISFWFGRWMSCAWGLGWNLRCGKNDDLGLLRSQSTYDHGGAGGARLFIDPENGLVVSLYMADKDRFNAYPNHSRVANIIYSALN